MNKATQRVCNNMLYRIYNIIEILRIDTETDVKFEMKTMYLSHAILRSVIWDVRYPCSAIKTHVTFCVRIHWLP